MAGIKQKVKNSDNGQIIAWEALLESRRTELIHSWRMLFKYNGTDVLIVSHVSHPRHHIQ